MNTLENFGRVGKNIRKIRELKNISPKDMAEKMDMSLSGYQRIERDEVSIDAERIAQVSEIFNVTPGQIFDFNEERIVFTITNNHGHQSYISNNEFPLELKKSYEENIATQKKTIAALEAQIELLMK